MLPKGSDSKEFDLLVFVGRFQPFHYGHLACVKEALEHAKHVLILIGTANSRRTARNPFTYDERQRMILDTVAGLPWDSKHHGHTLASRVLIRPLRDHLYNDDAWMQELQGTVYATIENELPARERGEHRIGLIGHAKDHTSYYLKIFPTFQCIDVPAFYNKVLNPKDPNPPILSSTDIRERAYAHVLGGSDDRVSPFGEVADALPPAVRSHLDRIWRIPPFRHVLDEVKYVHEYKALWSATPFPPTFTTVDALVACNGHVLMVERGAMPGKGQLALPGGFLATDETLLQSCVRELQEETQIDLSYETLRAACKDVRPLTFDDPYRSMRGRTITHVFRFDLKERRLPNVRGGDDAANALWLPISQISPEKCFEDHGHIVRVVLGLS